MKFITLSQTFRPRAHPRVGGGTESEEREDLCEMKQSVAQGGPLAAGSNSGEKGTRYDIGFTPFATVSV